MWAGLRVCVQLKSHWLLCSSPALLHPASSGADPTGKRCEWVRVRAHVAEETDVVLSFAVDGPYYSELHEALQGELRVPCGRAGWGR